MSIHEQDNTLIWESYDPTNESFDNDKQKFINRVQQLAKSGVKNSPQYGMGSQSYRWSLDEKINKVVYDEEFMEKVYKLSQHKNWSELQSADVVIDHALSKK